MESIQNKSSSLKDASRPYASLALWMLFSIFSFTLVGCSTPYMSHWGGNIGMDHAIYHLIGREWMNGSIPYAEYSDLKGPLLFAIFGVASIFTPCSYVCASIFLSMWVGVGMLFAFKTAKLFVNSWFAFAIICIYYYWTRWFAGNPTDIVWTMQHITLYYLICYATHKSVHITYTMLYVLGLITGACIAIKFNLLAYFLPICALVLITKELKFRKSFFALSLGCLTIILPFVCYFISKNALWSMVDEYFLTALRYGGCHFQESAIYTKNILLFGTITMLPVSLPISDTLKAIVGVVLIFSGFFIFKAPTHREKIVLLVLLICLIFNFIANFIGPHSYDQYYNSLIIFVYLSLLNLGRLVYNAKKRTVKTIFILFSIISFPTTILLANCFSFSKFGKEGSPGYTMKSDFNEIMNLTRNSNVLVAGGLSGLVSYYVISNEKPQLRYFIPPQTSNGRYLYESEIKKYIAETRTDFILTTPGEAQFVEQAIAATNKQFSLIKPASSNSLLPMLLYRIKNQRRHCVSPSFQEPV